MLIVDSESPTREQSITADQSVFCTHCDLPVPKGLVETGAAVQFCCGGCRTAYGLIHACGLDAFYRMAERGAVPLGDRDGNERANRFLDFDSLSFLEKFARPIGESEFEVTLVLDGIHCAACIWLIEKLPQIVPGVLEVKLNWARQTAHIHWDANIIPLSGIAGTLHRLGYTPHPVRQSENENRRRNENRKHLIRMGIAAAAAGNNMLIAGALYLGMFSYMSSGMSQLLRVTSCLVGLAALFWPGRVFIQGALNAIRTRTPHMDLPIALGLTVGSIAGVVNTIRGSGEIYFDSLSVLIFLLLVGRWIQFRQQNRAADAVELLYRLTPKITRRIIDGQPVETLVDLVAVGDTLEIRPGDLIPVDALVVRGTSQVDESILSGESRPLQKTIGDNVLAGTLNLNSVIVVRAVATGQETRLGRIVEQVEQAALRKPAIIEWANRIGGYFVISVILLAIATFLFWIPTDAFVAVDRAVALLIVACPCALALATPLAISVALGRAAKRRIMIKGGDVLQALSQPGIIWLDKTGTLTEGQLSVEGWYGDTRCQAIVAALEQHSAHPVASAIVEYVHKQELVADDIYKIPRYLIGQKPVQHVSNGIIANLFGSEFIVGSSRLLKARNVRITRRQQQIADRILASNHSPCWVAIDGNVAALIAVADQTRGDTRPAIEELQRGGWQVGILSGDHDEIVQHVAGRLGIEARFAFGGLSPEDKVRIVGCNVGTRTVVMVGDGVNDSIALASATVGIAVHNGAEASLAAAPVYLADHGLMPILELVKISRSTARTIRQNFAVSIGYNLVGATLAIAGLINPLVAAILMPISSLTVVAISLTAGRTADRPAKPTGETR